MSNINFVSENSLDEKRKERQEEWDKVRTAEDPKEAPEEEFDGRTLYDRLQEQKMKKDAEKEEAHKMRNMVQGLKKDETDFLDFVATKQMEHDRERELEEARLLREVKEARGKLPDEEAATTSGQSKVSSKPIIGASKRTGQSALLAGVVKRKRPSTSDSAVDDVGSKPAPKDDGARETKDRVGNGVATVIGVLPGIGEYTDSSNSDSEQEDDKIQTKHLGFMKSAKKKPKETSNS